jgi:hypothetical protein
MGEQSLFHLLRRHLMQRAKILVFAGAVLTLALLGARKSSSSPSLVATEPSTVAPSSPAAGQSPKDDVVYIDQAWSKEVRESYYHISQGSTVMPYDIFLNLEVAGGQDLFRANGNSERFGLILEPADPQTNPDGLPIGLSKTVTPEGKWKSEAVGLTCAACHEGELHYKGKRFASRAESGTHSILRPIYRLLMTRCRKHYQIRQSLIV